MIKGIGQLSDINISQVNAAKRFQWTGLFNEHLIAIFVECANILLSKILLLKYPAYARMQLAYARMYRMYRMYRMRMLAGCMHPQCEPGMGGENRQIGDVFDGVVAKSLRGCFFDPRWKLATLKYRCCCLRFTPAHD